MAPDPSRVGGRETALAELVALLERQLALAQEGDLEALLGLEAVWQRVRKLLPDEVPQGALPLLARAASLLQRTQEQLALLRLQLARERSRTGLAHAYRAGVEGLPRIDRRA